MSPAGRHTVKLQGIAIGYSELEEIDPALGRARGKFRPGVGYDLVQPVFKLFAEAVPAPGATVVSQEKLDRYYKSRDALGLQLEDDTGRVVATSSIHIEDYSGRRGGGLHVEVLVSDRGYWKHRERAG
jgi:hypothetical protein